MRAMQEVLIEELALAHRTLLDPKRWAAAAHPAPPANSRPAC